MELQTSAWRNQTKEWEREAEKLGTAKKLKQNISPVFLINAVRQFDYGFWSVLTFALFGLEERHPFSVFTTHFKITCV